ncbi:MAG: phage tail protein [Sphingobium sp.]
MATLVLTAVGSLLGPVGAAVGALAGQAIDAEIFKPAGRQGPRIADLRLQTSHFGTQMPRIHGRMRVAGTVIWATDLVESTQTSGGKGRPSVTSYDHSASFAVALSSRPVGTVGRIWADGNLLRGAAGDFKAGIAAFRFHDGSGDQPVDPLIAADRGLDVAPAHRGLAYAVFEGLQLADFGNRIPSLTFEVIAEEDAVAVSAIAASLAGGVAVGFAGGGEDDELGGYAVGGATAGEALQPLLDAHSLLLRAEHDGLLLTDGIVQDVRLGAADDLCIANGETLAAREVVREPVDAAPRRLSVRHYDRDRDYQAGAQSAERQGAGWGEEQVDLPATLPASDALRRAGDLLRRRMMGRRRATVVRGWDALTLGPGDVVALEGNGGWRVEAVEWEGMAVRLSLSGVPLRPTSAPGAADGGSGVHQHDAPVGPTHVLLVETPQLSDGVVDGPQIFVMASGESRGWRGAVVLLRGSDGGYTPAGGVRRAAAMGRTLSALSPGSAALFDDAATVEVLLHDVDAGLSPAGDAALLGGANICLIGEELVQFGTVSQTGPRSFRLGRMLRGRRGTERWMQGHGAGENFVLLAAEAMLVPTDMHAAPGRTVAIAAQGIGDAMHANADRVVDGRAMLPLAPTHLRCVGDAEAGLAVTWVRRSRLGWAWGDGAETPLGEEAEGYRVEIWAGEALLRSADVASAAWSYPAVDRLIDGTAGEILTLSVRQRGTHGMGAATVMTLPI